MTDPSRVRPCWATSIPAVRSLSLWPRAAFPKRAWCVPHSGLGAAGALPRALASFAQSARMARAQCPLFVSKNCHLLACILVLEPCIARDVRACAKVAAHRHTQISWSSQRAQPVHWRSHVFYTPLRCVLTQSCKIVVRNHADVSPARPLPLVPAPPLPRAHTIARTPPGRNVATSPRTRARLARGVPHRPRARCQNLPIRGLIPAPCLKGRAPAFFYVLEDAALTRSPRRDAPRERAFPPAPWALVPRGPLPFASTSRGGRSAARVVHRERLDVMRGRGWPAGGTPSG